MNWYKTINDIWESSQLEDTELLLLLAIAHHLNKRGIAYPGVDRLAKFIRKSRRQTQRLILKLADEGHIRVNWRGGPKGTNVYRICPLVQKGTDVQPCHSSVTGGGDIAMTPEVTSGADLLGDIQMSPELLKPELSMNGEASTDENHEDWKERLTHGSLAWYHARGEDHPTLD
jgi:hypothetical protein